MSTINEALIECVKAAGGSKTVGAALWPEKAPDAAQRLLLDCLSDDRPQKLAPEQLMLVAKLARDRGCHALACHVAEALSYAEPVPIKPNDEADELRRQVLSMGRDLQGKCGGLFAAESVA